MKPPWQLANLLESPAANGKQNLVDPIPIQTPPPSFAHREGVRIVSKGKKAVKAATDSFILFPCLQSTFMTYLGPNWGLEIKHFKRILHSSTNFHPNFKGDLPLEWLGKRWYGWKRQPDSSSVLKNLPSGLLSPGAPRLQLLLYVGICSREPEEQHTFTSSLLSGTKPVTVTTTS